MSFALDSLSGRIAIAICISVLLHALVLWGPNVQLPHSNSLLPPLTARLEKLPSVPVQLKPKPRPKQKHKISPPPQVKAEAEPVPQAAPVEEPQPAASALAAAGAVAETGATAASTPPAAETPAQPEADNAVERPPLPRRAQLTFAANKGTSDFKIGEVRHTLEIDDGHYVLQSVTETVGLAKIIKNYKLTQYSSGSYSKEGLKPEQFFEERINGSDTQRNTVEFDHATGHARFSQSGEVLLPPDTQDILSILYQFPPLAHAETVTIFVSNSRKIERYEFDIAANEDIQTAMGTLHTLHLRKRHGPNEEGLEVWLALEYRLFPVKMRIIEKDGEISGEVVITDIRAELEKEMKQDADH